MKEINKKVKDGRKEGKQSKRADVRKKRQSRWKKEKLRR